MGHGTSPVFVTGMHRSGTSLAAAMIAGAVDLGPTLVEPDENNPQGYFEDRELLSLNRRLLQAATAGSSDGHADWGWSPREQFDVGRLSAFRAEARALVRRRDHGAWGWKDPRLTVLLDFWDPIAPHAKWILVYRFPWDVAESMQQLGTDVFLGHPEYAWPIWRFYNQRILEFHERHRNRCLLLSSNALVRRPERLRVLAQERLGLAIEGPLTRPDRSLFRELSSPDPLVDLMAAVEPACMALLKQLDSAADMPAADLWEARPFRSRLVLPAKAGSPAARPRVSVVTPCRNAGILLADAIASVERVAPPHTEHIIVDDGSDERDTLRVMDVLRQSGMQVQRIDERRPSRGRNAAIERAMGEYILPLDADNRLRGGYIEAALNIMGACPETGVVYGDRQEFGLRNGVCRVPEPDLVRLLAENYIDVCALFRRRVWEDVGGFDGTLHIWDDWEFWLAAVAGGWQLQHIPVTGYEYRVLPGSNVTRVRDPLCRRRDLEHITRKHATLYARHLVPVVVRLRDAVVDQALRLEARDVDPMELDALRTRLADMESSLVWRLCRAWDRLRQRPGSKEGGP